MDEHLREEEAAEAVRRKPVAGWYPHPTMADTRRYWDGHAWTDHIAPGAAAPRVQPPIESGNNEGLMIAGIVMAVIFPIGGFIAGAVLLGRRPLAGTLIMLGSFACGFFFFTLGMSILTEQQHQQCLLDNVNRAMEGLPARDCG